MVKENVNPLQRNKQVTPVNNSPTKFCYMYISKELKSASWGKEEERSTQLEFDHE